MDKAKLDSFAQRLAEMQVLFRRQLPERIAEINEVWRQLQGEWSSECLTRLYRHSHSLYGNSATFGAREVGAAARALERRLKPLTNDTAPPSPALHDELGALVEVLTRSAGDWLNPPITTPQK